MVEAVAYHPLSVLVDKFMGIFNTPAFFFFCRQLTFSKWLKPSLIICRHPLFRNILYFCHQLAFSKVKANLGLDQATSCFTGAAPISVEVSVSELVNFLMAARVMCYCSGCCTGWGVTCMCLLLLWGLARFVFLSRWLS